MLRTDRQAAPPCCPVWLRHLAPAPSQTTWSGQQRKEKDRVTRGDISCVGLKVACVTPADAWLAGTWQPGSNPSPTTPVRGNARGPPSA